MGARAGLAGALLFLAMLGTGCSQAIIADSLKANDPGISQSPTGQPPVPPESLTIAPTGMSPVATSAVEPDAILPTMDEAYRTRRLPRGAASMPATRPSPAQHHRHMGGAP